EVRNVAPTATISNNSPVAEGTAATVNFTAQHDPSSVDTAIGFSYRYSCDGVLFSGPVPEPSTTCAFDDGPSDHTVRARISDKDGGTTEYETVVHVTNVAPDGTLTNDG